jgi:hypothetical protein
VRTHQAENLDRLTTSVAGSNHLCGEPIHSAHHSCEPFVHSPAVYNAPPLGFWLTHLCEVWILDSPHSDRDSLFDCERRFSVLVAWCYRRSIDAGQNAMEAFGGLCVVDFYGFLDA